jgi:hypothetical protein
MFPTSNITAGRVPPLMTEPKPRLGKHAYGWFAEEDLLRQVPKPPHLTRRCLNWSNCKKEEPLENNETSTTTTTTNNNPPTTSTTLTARTTFKGCGGCGAKYCCRDCQVSDWKAGHKKVCKSLKMLRTDPTTFGSTHRRTIVQRIIHEHRIYMCPFAVCKYNTQGRGFLLITSIDNPMNDFIYKRNVDMHGVLLDRRIELEYLDLGEFAELCNSDFELGVIRTGLVAAVEAYDPHTQMVVLWLAACGYLGVLTVPIVPDFGVCQVLGADHAKQRTIQLAMDVMDEEGEAEAAQAEMLAAEAVKQ